MKAQIKNIDGQAVMGYMITLSLATVSIGMCVYAALALR